MLREEIAAVVARGRQSGDVERVVFNTNIVCEFYGIGVSEDLSGEKIAKKYGWENKQDVDQCVKNNFIKKIEDGDLNSLFNMMKRFEEKPFWTSEEFYKLVDEYIGCEVSLGNFKKLIKKVCPEAEVVFIDYSNNNASRSELASGNFIAIKNSKRSEMKNLLIGVGQYGLVRKEEYVREAGKDDAMCQLVEALIDISPQTKIVQGEWYIRENKDNIIFNSLCMIASVTDSVRTDMLVKIIYQVIKGSRHKSRYTCPTEDVINDYLKDSIYIKQDEEYSVILVKAKKGNKDKRYTDVLNIFHETESNELMCSDFTRYLRERGNTRYNCTSILANCPLIFVDKTSGRGKRIVSFVKSFSKDNEGGRSLLNRAEELQYDRVLLDTINDVEYQMVVKLYEDKPKMKRKPRVENNKKVYPRDPQMSGIALAQGEHKCELEGCTTVLFKRRRGNVNYTEPHHIVPMALSDKYTSSLDVPGNIISLCSQCHNRLHYGVGYEEALTEIFYKREERLKKSGIDVSLEKLLRYYK